MGDMHRPTLGVLVEILLFFVKFQLNSFEPNLCKALSLFPCGSKRLSIFLQSLGCLD